MVIRYFACQKNTVMQKNLINFLQNITKTQKSNKLINLIYFYTLQYITHFNILNIQLGFKYYDIYKYIY